MRTQAKGSGRFDFVPSRTKCVVVPFAAVIGAACMTSGIAAGQSLGLDAVGYIEYVGTPKIEPAQFTVEAWIRPSGPGTNGAGTIVTSPLTGGCYGYAGAWFFWRFSDGRIALLLGHAPEVGMTVVSTGIVDLYQTAHVAATFDGTTAKIYINGQLDGVGSWTPGWSLAYAGYPIRIGATEHCGGYGYRFAGDIDEVRLWSRVLEPTEFLLGACAVDGPDLIAHWALDGDLTDRSGNGYDMVMVGEMGFQAPLWTSTGGPACEGCPACAADYDQNGGVDGGDIGAFFADFESGAACADVDLDGGVDGGDLAYFFQVFEAGGC